MDFTLTNEQKSLAAAVREMVGRRQVEPGENGAGPRPHDAELWAAMAETGLLGLPFAEEAGGFGATAIEVFVAAQALGAAGVQTAYADALLAGSLLADAGDDLLEAVVGGEAFVLPAFAEPMRAFAPVPGGVHASEGSDGWTLDGIKGPIPFGEAATHVIASALDGEETVLVLIEAPGIEDGLLAAGAGAGRVLLRGAAADEAVTRAIALASVVLAGQGLGAMESALSMTTEYLKTRKQFGVPLASFQTLTQRAADMYVSLELARSAAMYLAMAVAEGDTDPAIVARSRVVLGRTGRHIGQEAIQLHGGIAMTAEYAVGHLTAMLTAIEHTYGDTRQHLGALAGQVSDYGTVAVLT
ncbi:MAG TPA: acyl-CoA dehydrogenase [Intrasporangiaceae bacterium]|nr:acyl-CoA dehydrogenase [Intrasporangiaceae bacterium]